MVQIRLMTRCRILDWWLCRRKTGESQGKKHLPCRAQRGRRRGALWSANKFKNCLDVFMREVRKRKRIIPELEKLSNHIAAPFLMFWDTEILQVFLHTFWCQEGDIRETALHRQVVEGLSQHCSLVLLKQSGKKSHRKLCTGDEGPVKGHIPGGQHDLGVHRLGDALYQISMSTSVYIKSLPDSNIPRLVKSVTIIWKDVPEIKAI